MLFCSYFTILKKTLWSWTILSNFTVRGRFVSLSVVRFVLLSVVLFHVCWAPLCIVAVRGAERNTLQWRGFALLLPRILGASKQLEECSDAESIQSLFSLPVWRVIFFLSTSSVSELSSWFLCLIPARMFDLGVFAAS